MAASDPLGRRAPVHCRPGAAGKSLRRGLMGALGPLRGAAPPKDFVTRRVPVSLRYLPLGGSPTGLSKESRLGSCGTESGFKHVCRIGPAFPPVWPQQQPVLERDCERPLRRQPDQRGAKAAGGDRAGNAGDAVAVAAAAGAAAVASRVGEGSGGGGGAPAAAQKPSARGAGGGGRRGGAAWTGAQVRGRPASLRGWWGSGGGTAACIRLYMRGM